MTNKERVLKKVPDAYAYKAAPSTWRIYIMDGESLVTIGRGRTEAQAWKDASRDDIQERIP